MEWTGLFVNITMFFYTVPFFEIITSDNYNGTCEHIFYWDCRVLTVVIVREILQLLLQP